MFCEQVKRYEELRLGVLTADTESSVDQLQQTRSFRKHRVGFVQPLRQIKLQEQRDELSYIQIELVHHCYVFFVFFAARLLTNLCKQHEYHISTAEV